MQTTLRGQREEHYRTEQPGVWRRKARNLKNTAKQKQSEEILTIAYKERTGRATWRGSKAEKSEQQKQNQQERKTGTCKGAGLGSTGLFGPATRGWTG